MGQARILLMLALTKQLSSSRCTDSAAVSLAVEWLAQLWLVYDSDDLGLVPAIQFATRFLESLEACGISADSGGSIARSFRQLKAQVQTELRHLSKRTS